MHSAKAAHISPQGCAGSLASIAMNFSHAVRIIVTRPFTLFATSLAMLDRDMSNPELLFDSGIALPVVGVEHSRGRFHGCFNDFQARLAVGAVANEVTHLAAAAAFDRKNRRTVVFIRAMPTPLVSAPSRRVGRVAMRLAFSPRRSDIVHRLPARHQATGLGGHSQASCAEFVGATR